MIDASRLCGDTGVNVTNVQVYFNQAMGLSPEDKAKGTRKSIPRQLQYIGAEEDRLGSDYHGRYVH